MTTGHAPHTRIGWWDIGLTVAGATNTARALVDAMIEAEGGDFLAGRGSEAPKPFGTVAEAPPNLAESDEVGV